MKLKSRRSAEAAKENQTVPAFVSEIEDESLRLLELSQKTEDEMNNYYLLMLDGSHCDEDTQNRVDSLKRATGNMTKALVQTIAVSDELGARQSDLKKQRKKRRLIRTAPANATIDLSESRSEHFAKGLNIYKLLLICFVGSFAGVVIELLWCLITNGYLESRSGLVYGPFNLLYGIGAVALTACLYRFRNHGSWISFLGGFVVGSIVEYVCSWAQELVFGSRSWDYSHMPFNINGRICLVYSVFWGLLGVLWIKSIYPRMAKWILKIPNKAGKIITWVLVVFFVFNAFMSSVSLYRWSQRINGYEPSNAFEEFIDERFDNERMERIYANMKFSDEEQGETV